MRLSPLVIALAACPVEPQPVPPRPPAPEIEVAPGSVDFGDQAVGAMGPGRDVMIRNLGDAPLDVYEVAVSDPADGFSLGLGWGGAGVRIPAGLGRSFVVRFRPVAPGPYETAIKIVSNDSPRGQEIVIPLTGVGVTAELDVVEELTIADPGAPARVELELRNTGAAVLSIDRFSLTGSPAFQVDLDPDRNGALPFELDPLDPDTGRPVRLVYVTWDPGLATGDDEAELRITSNDWARSIAVVRLGLAPAD